MHGLYYSVYSKAHKTYYKLTLVEILSFDDILIYNDLIYTVSSH